MVKEPCKYIIVAKHWSLSTEAYSLYMFVYINIFYMYVSVYTGKELHIHVSNLSIVREHHYL